MASVTLSLTILVCILAGIAGGAILHRQLPHHHLSGDSKDAVRLGTGLIGTMAALVLGLLIASAKGSYDAQNSQVRQMTANIVLLDLLLEQYGTETRPIRDLMRKGIPRIVDNIWSEAASKSSTFTGTTEGEAVYAMIQRLSPTNEMQRSLQTRATQVATAVAQARLLLFTQRDDGVPKPFVAMLALWLTIIFGSFSMFADTNRVVIGALAIFAISATGAIYLILELSQPFGGLLQISSEPLSHALKPLSL